MPSLPMPLSPLVNYSCHDHQSIAFDSHSDRYGLCHSRIRVGYFGICSPCLIFALSELGFVKLLGRRSFYVVLEQQLEATLFAFVFTTIGVICNKDFQGMAFEGGKTKYYIVLIWSTITFQLGATIVLFLSSTVLAGVLKALRVPLTSTAAVVVLRE